MVDCVHSSVTWCMAEFIGVAFNLGTRGSSLPLTHATLLLSRVVQSPPLIHSFIHSFLSRQWELCWDLKESSWAGEKAVCGSCNPAVRETRFSVAPGLLLTTCECPCDTWAPYHAQCCFTYWRGTETHDCFFSFSFSFLLIAYIYRVLRNIIFVTQRT